ncbi:reverse transcriptase domain-containing protein [Tanacetum coccineum]|uniref:Reverse transcriptase domain-containing protein n=1 Tax=Tanacetum coccineum TaxID=301880 RepID=A0ABQ4WL86_9ASTR
MSSAHPSPSQCNIVGDPGLKDTTLRIPSTIHSMIKFPHSKGITTLNRFEHHKLLNAENEKEKQMICGKMRHKRRGRVDVYQQIIVNPAFQTNMVTMDGRLLSRSFEAVMVSVQCFSDASTKREVISSNPNAKEDEEKTVSTRRKGPPFLQHAEKHNDENKHEITGWNAEAERGFSAIEKDTLSRRRSPQSSTLDRRNGEAIFPYNSRLRRYFEAHPVTVITDQPIINILIYRVKLADFLLTPTVGRKGRRTFRVGRYSPKIDDTGAWTLYTDGVASSKDSGAGLILIGPSGVEYAYARRLTFASTNNEAEYEALLARLRIARMMNVLRIEVKVDSKLVASQINGMYEASNGSMIKYLAKARKCISEFKTFSIENIPRGNNQKADVLSKLATMPFHNLTKEILVEVLIKDLGSTEGSMIKEIVEVVGVTRLIPPCTYQYLEEGIAPSG